MTTTHPPIIDYEGSRYRTDFWEGRGREYEDLAERYALRRLLPPSGEVLIEAGAGFGRLADLYQGYRRVVLVDYSFSLLQEARQRWGDDPRFLFVAASLYDLPFTDHSAAALVMVRVMHHLHSPALALREIGRVLHTQGAFLLEYANKRHLKAILRYLAGRQAWSPFALPPYEFVRLNYDFHPAWMQAAFMDIVMDERGRSLMMPITVTSDAADEADALSMLTRARRGEDEARVLVVLDWVGPLEEFRYEFALRDRALRLYVIGAAVLPPPAGRPFLVYPRRHGEDAPPPLPELVERTISYVEARIAEGAAPVDRLPFLYDLRARAPEFGVVHEGPELVVYDAP